MVDAPMVVEVVTPEASLLQSGAEAIVLRSSDGDLTVLPGHTPLVTDVDPGLVRVDRAEGDPVRLAVHGGYLHVDTGHGVTEEEGEAVSGSAVTTRVRLLAGVAERAEDIDEARAERAREEAEARLGELRSGVGREAEGEGEGADPELSSAEADLRRAEVRLAVARGEAPSAAS